MSFPNYDTFCGAVYTQTHQYIDTKACDPSLTTQPMAAGITTWSLGSSTITIPKRTGGVYQSATFTFTCTFPYCYSSKDVCNVSFDAHANQSLTNPLTEDVFLGNALNTIVPQNLEGAGGAYSLGGFHLPGVAGYGGTQTTDISRIPDTYYRDPYNYFNHALVPPETINGVPMYEPGPNTFYLTNYSTVDVSITSFKILRAYHMGNLQTQNCVAGSTFPTNGTALDNSRIDKPCNYQTCGGLSYTFVYDGSNAYYTTLGVTHGILAPNGTMTWVFDFTNQNSPNYLNKEKCLFNFNQLYAGTTDTNNPYVKLDAYINGYSFTSYYISNQSHHGFFPSYDLTQNENYHDTGLNTVSLVNRGTINVEMTIPDDGINVYRIFATRSICDCASCETCQTGCETCFISQTCWPACITCNHPCYILCQVCNEACQTCNICEAVCQTVCESSCQGCQTTCETVCEDCQTCNDCQAIQYCPIEYYTCQGCEWCQPCYSCQTACELACQDCQTGCEVSCQDCQVCVTCQTIMSCPPPFYTCQACEFCHPAGYT